MGRRARKPLQELTGEEIRAAVVERYGKVAVTPAEKFGFPVGREVAKCVGYDPAMLDRFPESM